MNSPGKIAGFGIPLLDFIAEVDDKFLANYHLDCNNSTQASQDQAGLYEVLSNLPGVQMIPGGAVPNALRIAQWLLRVPHSTISFGCIGDDQFGRTLTRQCESEGVRTQYQVHSTVPTGTCAVLITEQNRCLCANFAAAKCLSADFIEKGESLNLIQSASCIYLVGYFIHTYPNISRRVLKLVRSGERVLAVNLSAVYVCQQSTDGMLEAIQHADFVFGNETEIQAIATALEWKETDEADVMMKMSNLPSESFLSGRNIVITHGPQPTKWCDGKSIKSYAVSNIPNEKIVDTCGAGDAFVGGFLSQLVQGKEMEEGIRCGHYAAGLSIQQRGLTISGSPDFR